MKFTSGVGGQRMNSSQHLPSIADVRWCRLIAMMLQRFVRVCVWEIEFTKDELTNAAEVMTWQTASDARAAPEIIGKKFPMFKKKCWKKDFSFFRPAWRNVTAHRSNYDCCFWRRNQSKLFFKNKVIYIYANQSKQEFIICPTIIILNKNKFD